MSIRSSSIIFRNFSCEQHAVKLQTAGWYSLGFLRYNSVYPCCFRKKKANKNKPPDSSCGVFVRLFFLGTWASHYMIHQWNHIAVTYQQIMINTKIKFLLVFFIVNHKTFALNEIWITNNPRRFLYGIDPLTNVNRQTKQYKYNSFFFYCNSHIGGNKSKIRWNFKEFSTWRKIKSKQTTNKQKLTKQ